MNTLVGVDHRNTIKPKSVKSIKSVKSGSDRERGKKFCWDKDNSGLLSEKEFKRNLPKLKNIVLIGTGIGENLGELLEAFRRPQIEKIDLQYNGITKEYCTGFAKYMFSFGKQYFQA